MTSSEKDKLITKIIIFLSVFIVIGSGIAGFVIWRNNIAFRFTETPSFMIGESDFTQPISYFLICNAYAVSFMFTCYGIFIGIMADAFIWLVWFIVHECLKRRRKYDKELEEIEKRQKNKEKTNTVKKQNKELCNEKE